MTGALVITAGVALVLVRFFGEAQPGRNLETAVGAIAFGAVIAAPGVLALLALHDRPALLLPAAMLLIPLSFISFALVTLPLLVPAFLLFRTYARAAVNGSGLRTVATTAVVFLLLVAAFVALLAHEDPREFVGESATFGTSDIVTYAETAISLALTSGALAIGWRFASRDAMPV
ncbi:MAG: hypothetical protein AAB327_05905 [Actinomycetota bacterium]